MENREKLEVQIEADLSQLKRELAGVEREAGRVAGNMTRSFAEVGRALDLSRFRKELVTSEKAAARFAENVKRSFSAIGGTAGSSGKGAGTGPSGTSSGEVTITERLEGAAAGGTLTALVTHPLTHLPPIRIVLILGGAAAGALAPELVGRLGNDDPIKKLESQISALQSEKRFLSQFSSDVAEIRKKENQGQIDALTSLRDALLQQQSQAREAGSQNQECIRSFTQLSDCLHHLCVRLDEIGLQGSGGGAGLTDGAGNDVLFRGAAFDQAEDTLVGFTRRLREVPGGFEAARQAAEDFGGETRTLNGLLEKSNLQFTEQTGLIGALRRLVPELGGELNTLLEKTTQGSLGLSRAAEALGGSFFDAFRRAALGGRNLSDVLRQLAEDVLRIPRPGGGGSFLSGLFGSIFGGGSTSSAPASTPAFFSPTMLAAKGGVFDKGKAQRFAAGGVLGRATLFPLAGGIGLAGEAGPEAILPLARLSGGKLGVRASLPRIPDVPAQPASSAVNHQVVFNIDARGADRAGLLRVERAIQRIDSTLERRAVGAVMSSRRRGGNIARAFGAR